MGGKQFWSALALGAVAILVWGPPLQAKDRSEDSSRSSASSDDSSSRQENQKDSQKDNSSQRTSRENTSDTDNANAQHHAALGVSLQDDDGRLRVIAVLPGSPAANAGIRNGDEINSVEGERVRTAQQLVDEIGEKQPGAQVSIGIRRNGDRQTVRAKLVSLDTLHSRNASSDRTDRNRGDEDSASNQNRSGRSAWNMNRGRSASFDEEPMAQGQERVSRQLRALQQQVMRLEQEVDDLRAGRSGRQTTGYRGDARTSQGQVQGSQNQGAQGQRSQNTAQAPAYQGNGDNGWYYQVEPDSQNQGIHDYGARARDGQ